ncbi:hypothetical protein [Saccharopolyspora sp. NPDC050642]|uniref:hypothetical protein n=1 Tax=Saccharopolyspora sp. NPDC050642 TaxID=3157099 RepID=UPI0033F2913E
MRAQSFTVRHIGGAWSCIALLVLTAFLATHVVIGLDPAHSAAVHAGANASNLPSQECDNSQHPGDDDTTRHGPIDSHCGLSARDISPFLDTAAPEPEAWPPFPRSDHGWISLASSSHPALPPSGRQILASSCTSRT